MKPDNSITVAIGSVSIRGDINNPPSPGDGIGLTGAQLNDSNGMPITYYGQLYGIIWQSEVETPSQFTSWNGSSTDYGTWNFTQLIDSSRSLTGTNGYSRVRKVSGPPPYLDGPFPYKSFTANGEGHAGDASWMGFNNTTHVAVNESFKTYTLYAAPGDSRFVPLKDLSWFWAGQGTLGGSGWTLSNGAQGWSLGGDFPSHPLWNYNSDIYTWEIQ
ncbi:MAG: hypothetical protein EOO88_45875 [Pedobacter sp.]|nr:MAG: hypothetical protein EOO88_45875 [Pedobacter sp.]